MGLYVSIAVFLFSAIALVVPSGYSVGLLMLLLGCFNLMAKKNKTSEKILNEELILILVLLFYFLINFSLNLIHGAQIAEYDEPSRYALVIPVFFLLRRFPPTPRFFWAGIATGAISSGFFSGWQFFSAAHTRAGGFTNPIQFGNISMLFGILCAAGIGWAVLEQRRRFWSFFLACGVVSGLLGSLFSESRGSWLALPVALVFIGVAYFRFAIHKRLLAGGAVAIMLVLALAVSLPMFRGDERIRLAVAETQSYVASGDSTTSVGARLEMWRTSLILFPMRPLLGWGKDGYIKGTEQLVEAGRVRLVPGKHTHPHNEYLDALVKRGVLGLIALLALYTTSLVIFLRHIRDAKPSVRPYAIAGASLVISYLCFGLTQSFLTHNIGVTEFLLMLIILWSLLRSEQNVLRNIGLKKNTF
ncbi:MAG: O-antigen ligase [Bradyrhizobium sp.]|jgi:O-antigen ligase